MKQAYVHVQLKTADNGRRYEECYATDNKFGGGNLIKLTAGFFDEGYYMKEQVKFYIDKWNGQEGTDEGVGCHFNFGKYIEMSDFA